MKSNPGRVLIRKCNKVVKEARIKAKYFENQYIQHIPTNTLFIEDNIIDRAVREVLRINDVQRYEKQCTNRKFGNKLSNKIDIEARVVFTSGTTTGLIKIALGYDHYKQR